MLKTPELESHSAPLTDLTTMTASARLLQASLLIAVSDDAARALAQLGLALKSVPGAKRWRTDRRGLTPEGGVQGLRLVWPARADFGDDGWEDALHRVQAWVRSGTWTSRRTVGLTRRGPFEPLVSAHLNLK